MIKIEKNPRREPVWDFELVVVWFAFIAVVLDAGLDLVGWVAGVWDDDAVVVCVVDVVAVVAVVVTEAGAFVVVVVDDVGAYLHILGVINWK